MKICSKKTKRITPRVTFLFKITTIWMYVGLYVSAQAQDLQIAVVASEESRIQIETMITENSIIIKDAMGFVLQQAAYTFPTIQDPTFMVYASPYESIIRENVANFLWINRRGKIIHSESNSSGSEDGEAVSEFASDPQFRTQVIYNPKIVFGNSMGSSAQIITSGKKPISLHFSTHRQLRGVHVSSNGAFIALVTAQDGLDDLVKVFDRYGNSIAEWEFSQPVEGIEFSEEGRYHTLFSGGRVGVYDSYTAKRIGSSSIRGNPILRAAYLPLKNTIAVLTADVMGTSIQQSGTELSTYPTVEDLELHEINVEERRITKQSVPVSKTKQISPFYLSQKDSRLILSGLTSEITLR